MADTTALALSISAKFLVLGSSTGLTPGFTRIIHSGSVTLVTVGESPAGRWQEEWSEKILLYHEQPSEEHH
jgi:hypothetical protein